MNTEVDVAVPGFGICILRLHDLRMQFIRDSQTGAAERKCGIQSLKLMLATVKSDEVMMDFLQIIGTSVRSISITMMTHSHPVAVDLSALAIACPRLRHLHLKWVNIYISVHNEALRNWGLKKLYLQETENPVDLATCLTCLTDCTMRMSRELVELKIFLSRPPAQVLQGTATVDELISHNGDVLPVAEEKVPRRSKAAFLSAVKNENNANHCVGYSKAVRRLDENIIVAIFEFANTPEQRSVQVSPCQQIWAYRFDVSVGSGNDCNLCSSLYGLVINLGLAV